MKLRVSQGQNAVALTGELPNNENVVFDVRVALVADHFSNALHAVQPVVLLCGGCMVGAMTK
jgi:hypothetical protein